MTSHDNIKAVFCRLPCNDPNTIKKIKFTLINDVFIGQSTLDETRNCIKWPQSRIYGRLIFVLNERNWNNDYTAKLTGHAATVRLNKLPTS